MSKKAGKASKKAPVRAAKRTKALELPKGGAKPPVVKATKVTPAVKPTPTALGASVILLVVALMLCISPTMRLLRIYLQGDSASHLASTINIDGVKAKWGYAKWSLNEKVPFTMFGLTYMRQVSEVVHPPLQDHNISEGPLNIDGQAFTQGIGSRAPSKIAFDLGGKYKRFFCKAGLDRTSGFTHGVIFSVIADGKEIYRGPKIKEDADPLTIDVPVTGVSELILYADNTQWDDVQSDVDWVDLKFE